MAMNTTTRQYSKKTLFNVLMVVLLGWFVLFLWSMTLWLSLGFASAWQRLSQLSNQQRAAIVQFSDASLAERLNTVWAKLPNKPLMNKVSALNRVIHKKLHLVLPSNALSNHTDIQYIIDETLKITQITWVFIGITSQIMLIKLTILMAAIPLFLLTMTAGLVDGLNQRAIRTASLGRESSYVFHQLNRWFKRGLIALLALWLAIPVSITPALMLVPVSILLSVMVSVTASRFKKYL